MTAKKKKSTKKTSKKKTTKKKVAKKTSKKKSTKKTKKTTSRSRQKKTKTQEQLSVDELRRRSDALSAIEAKSREVDRLGILHDRAVDAKTKAKGNLDVARAQLQELIQEAANPGQGILPGMTKHELQEANKETKSVKLKKDIKGAANKQDQCRAGEVFSVESWKKGKPAIKTKTGRPITLQDDEFEKVNEQEKAA